MASRAENEIRHGEKLALEETEMIWGWGTPAGRLRADRRAELIIKGAGLKTGKQVLEIGCGTGMFTEKFVATGAQVFAVDISEALLAKARKRGLPKERVQFLNKRFEDCDVDGPFDAVIGSSVLHHLDIEITLGKIFSLLKPGGLLSFAEPNMLNPQVAMQLRFRRFLDYMSPDETAFIEWRLRNLLAVSGFGDIEVLPFDWLHPATPPSMISAVILCGSILERIPYIRQFAGSLYIRARRNGA